MHVFVVWRDFLKECLFAVFSQSMSLSGHSVVLFVFGFVSFYMIFEFQLRLFSFFLFSMILVFMLSLILSI